MRTRKTCRDHRPLVLRQPWFLQRGMPDGSHSSAQAKSCPRASARTPTGWGSAECRSWGVCACWQPLDGLPARRTVSRTRLPSPLRPRLRSRRAASAICSVSSIRRFLIHRFLIRCLPSARRIQRLPQQSGMRCNRLCVQPMTRHPPCVSLSLPRGRRAAGPATACGATLRRFAGRAGGSTHARLQSAAAREDQTECSFDSGAAPRGTGGPWVYTRAHRCAQPTPGSVRDRRCHVSA